ncbi:MAG: RNA-binding transcriptional accessory protein [Erysipelotrichales bacterium]|nr:RNA-binding transcriptional accessory protein [Erysipelotrichales bacterium]
MEYINDELIKKIADEQGIKTNQVVAVLELLKEGNTVPFIARYRKEKTDGLDEEDIRAIEKAYEYGEQLNKRKEDVIRLIDEKGLLTDELRAQIENSTKLVEIEDLYRPFKEKKKTKATEAIKNGLEPLAKLMLTFPLEGTLESIAIPYINENVLTWEDAIQGAKYIIAEIISDNAEYRKHLRFEMTKEGLVVTKIKKNAKDELKTYENYYEYQERIKTIKPHRILAVNRAENESVVGVSISYEQALFSKYLQKQIIFNHNSFVVLSIVEAIDDSIKRLIYPSVEREIRAELTEAAEIQAIEIFSVNLKNLLLTPPMKGKVVLGVDPAYRTGCKLAVVDQTGKVLAKDVIYPHEKYKGENLSPERVITAKDKVKKMISKFKVEIIAIGNGTASRETETFISNIIKEINDKVYYLIVSEAGASVYSASELAREEFPDYEVEERSAVSIARRLQDPLSELVKIDPKSIGVGQYQHDVTQSKLTDSLDFVVQNAVNSVGVNANTASKALLQYVSGLNKGVAENLVKYRDDIGGFKNRQQLKKVPKLGSKTYEQAIGFLRIPEGTEALDITSIHPESYEIAKMIMIDLSIASEMFGTQAIKEIIDKADKNQLMTKYNIDKFTLSDVLDAFASPLRDPRDSLDKPILRSDVLNIEDLQEGMELHGTVRNVVDFGAFVDCGLKNDGLVHISKISNNYIKHPSDVLSVGDLVKVYVLSVDVAKQKVGLTMIKNSN